MFWQPINTIQHTPTNVDLAPTTNEDPDLSVLQNRVLSFLASTDNLFSHYQIDSWTRTMYVEIYPRLYNVPNLMLWVYSTTATNDDDDDGTNLLLGFFPKTPIWEPIRLKTFYAFFNNLNKKQLWTFENCLVYTVNEQQQQLDRMVFYPLCNVFRLAHVDMKNGFCIAPYERYSSDSPKQWNHDLIREEREKQQTTIASSSSSASTTSSASVQVACTGNCGRKTMRPTGTTFTCKRCNLPTAPTF